MRTKKGFSIDRLSKQGDRLSPAAIHRLENAKSDPQFSVLYRIAEVLGVHVKDLLSFDMPDE